MTRMCAGQQVARALRLAVLVGLVLPGAATLAQQPHDAPASEQLIVFMQPEADDPVSAAFASSMLPAVRDLAQTMGVELVTVDVGDGAAAQVGLTPLMVYQNHRGRSVYQGRFTTLDRVRNHIRTGRFMPGGDTQPLTLDNLPVKSLGRMKLGTPIKITDLTGDVPADFDPRAFRQAMTRAVADGMAQAGYTWQDQAGFGPSDRLFYIDFYPARHDGKLFVSLALFSQFHCHEPVFTSGDEPTQGPWADRRAVFARAAERMAEQIQQQMENPDQGDGFVPLDAQTPVKSWAQLNLPLPPAPPDARRTPADLQLVRDWRVLTPDDGRPAIAFRFPPPLRGYAGEATQLSGTVRLGPDLSLPEATGTFTVATPSVTMGEPDLDSYIHGTLLEVDAYPRAQFQLDRVQTAERTLTFGRVSPGVLVGRFTMKDQTIDLEAPVSIEAYADGSGRPRLLISGQWRLPLLKVWGIEGPPGPQEASSVLVFTCRIVLEPAADADADDQP